MSKIAGALAVLLVLSHPAYAGAAPASGEQSTCTRRAAIWQRLFQDGAGFVVTGLLAPDDRDRGGRNTHRNVAIGSMAVSTVSYLIMLIGR
jgi:hypothetical protein